MIFVFQNIESWILRKISNLNYALIHPKIDAFGHEYIELTSYSDFAVGLTFKGSDVAAVWT